MKRSSFGLRLSSFAIYSQILFVILSNGVDHITIYFILLRAHLGSESLMLLPLWAAISGIPYREEVSIRFMVDIRLDLN